MTQELLYTSAPRGLKPGVKGFCTVASSAGMAPTLADRLESLSGYRHLFPAHDPQARLNPVLYSHLLLKVGGQKLHVLSRICDAGLDYSQRSNKFAHHVALTEAELPPGGPAWVMSQPGFMEVGFSGEPRILPAGRNVPRAEVAPRVCRVWETVTGDAGWAGVLAETGLGDGLKTVNVIFPTGTDVLPLVDEAMALLPARRRWAVTFSTFYTKLPPGIDCQWRFLVDGEAEAKTARRTPQTMLIDLCANLGPAEGGPLVSAARTGQAPDVALPEPASLGARAADETHLPAHAPAPFLTKSTQPERPEQRAPTPPRAPAQHWPTISPTVASGRGAGNRKKYAIAALKVLALILLVAGTYALGEKRGREKTAQLSPSPDSQSHTAASAGETASPVSGRRTAGERREQEELDTDNRKTVTPVEKRVDKRPVQDTTTNSDPAPANGSPGAAAHGSQDSEGERKELVSIGPGTGANAVSVSPVDNNGVTARPKEKPRKNTQPPFHEVDRKLWDQRGLGLNAPNMSLNPDTKKANNHYELVKVFPPDPETLAIELWSPVWGKKPVLSATRQPSGEWHLSSSGMQGSFGSFKFDKDILSFDWGTNVPTGVSKPLQSEAWLRIHVGNESRDIPLRTPDPIATLQENLVPGEYKFRTAAQTELKKPESEKAKLELRCAASDEMSPPIIAPSNGWKEFPSKLVGQQGELKWRVFFTNQWNTKEFGISINALGMAFVFEGGDVQQLEAEKSIKANMLSDCMSRASELAKRTHSELKEEQNQKKPDGNRVDTLGQRLQRAKRAHEICEQQRDELDECAKIELVFRVYRQDDIADQ